MNLFMKQKQSHGCRKQTYNYEGMGDRLEDWDWHLYTAVYKQITNKNLHSTETSIFSDGLYGKRIFKKKSEYMYMYN